MTPERAGELCERLDKSLRGSEVNLEMLADSIVVVLRDEAWRERRIRTGKVVRCQSFLELLTAKPLHGFGEDPKRVEALLRDDAEALRMFRAATTAEKHKHHATDNNNVIIKPAKQGNSRSYTLDRLQRTDKALYQQVIDGKLSANAAAIKAGFRKVPRSPLQHLHHWWHKATHDERLDFLRTIRME